MNSLQKLFLLLILSICFSAQATEIISDKPDTSFTWDTISVPDSLINIVFTDKQEVADVTGADTSRTAKFKIKKRIAAVLAFPFPFGLLGLHRVFLGTKPYIPFVYIGTLGGCFLILPIIDFIAILSADEETFRKFENNPKVFMWSH